MAVRCSHAVAPRAVPASARNLTDSGQTNGTSFPRRVRLTEPRQYKAVFAGARRLGDRNITVLALPNGLDHPRLGLAIARKTANRAVDRNRIKRLVRESFRQQQHLLGGYDLVVISKPGIVHADNDALRRSIENQWRRLGRACDTR
jgi:ribonuclease P protein component